MEGKRIPKRILESNFIGKRPVSKPRKRWINAVEIESREILKVRNWKRESQDRQVWRRCAIEEEEESIQLRIFSRLLSKNLKIKTYKTIILPFVLYGCETWSLTLREEH
jgi:hypothetical protein